MALSTTLNFTMVDAKGETSNTKVRVPTTFSIAQYVEFGQALAQLLVEITNCSITGVSINFGLDLSSLGFKTVASAVEKVAAKAQGLFNTVSGIIAKWLIPAPIEEKVVTGSDDFDQTDSDIAALVSAFEDGIAVTDGTIQFTNGRGGDITSIASLKETFRRRSPE